MINQTLRRKWVLGFSLLSLSFLSLVLHQATAAEPESIETGKKPLAIYADKIQSASSQDGPNEIEVLEKLVLHDATRSKDLQVKAKIPQGPGPFPVIVFSHGRGASKDSYGALTRYWATNGYVCFQPAHDDSKQLQKQENMEPDDTPIAKDYEGWRNRALDVKLVLDSLSDISKRPKFQGKMDLNRIGVAGHSYGAFTTELVSGAKIKIPKEGIVSLADSRVKAFEEMSPSGLGDSEHMGIANEHGWDDVHSPVIVFTGTNDQLKEGYGTKWHQDAYKFLPPGDKYLEFITGATHNGYVNKPKPGGKNAPADPSQPSLLDYTKIGSLAFWDAYLKDDEVAKKYLNSQKLQKFSNGIVKLDHK